MYHLWYFTPALHVPHIRVPASASLPGRPSKARQDAAAPRRRQTAKPAAAARSVHIHTIHRQAADKISNQLSDQEKVSEVKLANTFK